jgi:hypothetical protein
MLRGRFNPYAVVNFMMMIVLSSIIINGVVDPRATYNEYIDIKDKMSKYNRLLRRAGDETQQRELDGVKLKLAAFYIKNPRNPRDEDEPHTDADAIVYDYILYQS